MSQKVEKVHKGGGVSKNVSWQNVKKKRENEKKTSFKSKQIKDLYEKSDVFKEWFCIQKGFFKRKFPDGASTIFIESRSKNFIEGGQKFLRSTFFRGMLTVSQGGGGVPEPPLPPPGEFMPPILSQRTVYEEC